MTQVAGTRIVLDPTPPAHVGAGATHRPPDFGITAADFGGIAADALDDEVLASTPRWPAGDDIRAILTGALDGIGQVQPTRAARPGPGGG